MARNITVTFDDGTTHVYQNAPDDATPDAVSTRAAKDFGKTVVALDGGRKNAPKETDAQRRQRFTKNELLASPFGSVARGLKDIVDTGARGAAWLSDLATGGDESGRVKRLNTAGTKEFADATEGRVMPSIGRLGGNLALTAPAVAALGAGATAAKLPSVGNAIASYGARAGLPNRAADIALRTGGGAVSGGLTAGMIDPDHAGMGALIGGAAVPVFGGAAALGAAAYNRVLRPMGDLVSKSGPANVLGRYIRNKVGAENVPATLEAAKSVLGEKAGPGVFPVKGYKPTLAEAMTNIPEGSPLVALQDITASTAGGVSSKFGKHTTANMLALDKAKVARDAIAAPQREAALAAANKRGGVNADDVLELISKEAAKPANEASTLVSKSLEAVRDKIASRVKDGKIDAEALYTIRKELGNTIQGVAQKAEIPFDKGITARTERQIQLAIDDAMEASGATGWKDYLREYAGKSKAIDSMLERMQEMYKPVQKTNLGGGTNIAEETRGHIPQLLSRAAMASNFVLRTLGKRIEPKVDELAAKIFTDPQAYLDLMKTVPKELRFEIDKALRTANAGLLSAAQE